MGRPRIEIDQEQFEKLCKMQCTEEEIAAWYGCSVDTIERWCKRTYKGSFAEVFAQKRTGGKASLRASQWKLAQKSPAMAIFLGKNYLGQTDRVEQTVTASITEEARADVESLLMGDTEQVDGEK